MAEAILYSSGQTLLDEINKDRRIWGKIEAIASSFMMLCLCVRSRSSAFYVFNGIRQSKWPRKIELSNSESTRLVISVHRLIIFCTVIKFQHAHKHREGGSKNVCVVFAFVFANKQLKTVISSSFHQVN